MTDLHVDIVMFVLHSNGVWPCGPDWPDLALVGNFGEVLVELSGALLQFLRQMSLRLLDRRLAILIAERDKGAVVN